MAHNDYHGAGGDNYNRPPGSFADHPPAPPSPSIYSRQPGSLADRSAAPSSPSLYNQGLPPYPSPSPIQPPATANHPTYASPFDTAFDDNVYPMNPHSRPPSTSVGPYSSTMSLPPHQDTTYYGAGNVSPESGRPYPPENIPLQDRYPKDPDAEMGTDHVYDAPGAAAAAAGGRTKKKQKIGLGQLGMIGSDSKRIPWVTYILTAVQIIVFIVEIARNGVLTGSPIMIKPQFNPMIGPSPWVLINVGARFSPCMHNIAEIQGAPEPYTWPCPNSTAETGTCSLSDLCGFSGVPNPKGGDENQKPEPNQWFRLIIPIFLHAGLIHLLFNMLLQMTIGKDMERSIGPVRYFLVYISAGIFGCIMGANYAVEGVPSVGASGSLFGVIALVLLDLLYSWQERKNPVKDLLFIILDIVISFVLGLLPYLDNFAHIGGFIMGLGLGVCVLHSPNALRRRLGDDTPYTAVTPGFDAGMDENPAPFYKNPVGFFKGRKPLWWVWWVIRAGCLISVIVAFIVLLNNFYVYRQNCSWCKYLSCIPIKDWCEAGKLQLPEETPQPS